MRPLGRMTPLVCSRAASETLLLGDILFKLTNWTLPTRTLLQRAASGFWGGGILEDLALTSYRGALHKEPVMQGDVSVRAD